MDKHFYVMEKKEGIVVDGELPPEYEDNKETSALLSENVIGTLAELQSIDYQQGGWQSLANPRVTLNDRCTDGSNGTSRQKPRKIKR